MDDPKIPTHVFEWIDFETETLQWVSKNHETMSRRIDRPKFPEPFIITEEIQSLQPFIKMNLLDIVSKCTHGSSYKAIRECQVTGQPDYVLCKDGDVAAIVEIKGKWTVDEQNIVTAYYRNRFVASALNQLYHYMRLNHKKYGILSTYDYTWFCFRTTNCTLCPNTHPTHETLFVTNGIHYTSSSPTVQQAFVYFASIADSAYVPSPPKPATRSTSAKVSRPGSPQSSGAIRSLPSSGSSTTSSDSVVDQDLEIEMFTFDSVLGEGRSKVYLEQTYDEKIALKTSDIYIKIQ
jgi:hypothetical protein